MHALHARGDEVTRVVRSFKNVSARERVVVWHPQKGQIEAAKLEAHDAVVNLAGESLLGVWTPGKKREIRESRVQGTDLLARTLAQCSARPAVLVSTSGINYYGNAMSPQPIDESAPPGTGFMAEVAVAWERAANPAYEAGIRVVHPRFANILSPGGGMLEILLPLFRLGLGARLGTGEQPWPWVALEDVVRAILFLIDRSDTTGPVNVAAPDAVTNAEFTDALARAVHRPSVLRVPEFALKLAPGNFAEQLILSGLHIVPAKLQAAGFEFRHPRLDAALAAMLR